MSILPLPPLDAVVFFRDPAPLDLDLVASLALIIQLGRVHHQFHPACLAGPVFASAVLSEMAPLVAAADESFLVVVTHIVDCR